MQVVLGMSQLIKTNVGFVIKIQGWLELALVVWSFMPQTEGAAIVYRCAMMAMGASPGTVSRRSAETARPADATSKPAVAANNGVDSVHAKIKEVKANILCDRNRFN